MPSSDDDDRIENHMSIEELRRGYRKMVDSRWDLIKALRDLPEIPPYDVMLSLSYAAKWSDIDIGKRIQREKPDTVPYKTEAELGMGFYSRLRQGVLAGQATEKP